MRGPPPIGTIVAGYRLVSLVGEGATGAVYLAVREGAPNRVALKLLDPELARNQRFRKRLLRESTAADDGERQEVATSADAEVHWVTRDGRPPGTTTALIDALRGLAVPAERGQAWGGGEALAMRDVRRHLAGEHPPVAGSMSILGYWKHRSTPEGVD